LVKVPLDVAVEEIPRLDVTTAKGVKPNPVKVIVPPGATVVGPKNSEATTVPQPAVGTVVLPLMVTMALALSRKLSVVPILYWPNAVVGTGIW